MAEDKRIAEVAATKKQHDENNNRIIRLEERRESCRRLLKEIVDEIVAQGFDPKTFEAEVARLDKEFDEKLEKYKSDVSEQSSVLAAIEASL